MPPSGCGLAQTRTNIPTRRQRTNAANGNGSSGGYSETISLEMGAFEHSFHSL